MRTYYFRMIYGTVHRPLFWEALCMTGKTPLKGRMCTVKHVAVIPEYVIQNSGNS